MQIETVAESPAVLDESPAGSWPEREPSATDADPELLDEFLSRLQAIIRRSPARLRDASPNRLRGRA